MSNAAIILLVVAIVLPVAIALGISRFVLARLAARMAESQKRPIQNTVFQAIRLPIMFLAWLFSAYLASLVLRVQDIPDLNTFHWSTFETWLEALATLDAFFIFYRVMLYGVRIATTHADAGSAVLVRKLMAAVLSAIAIVTVLNQFHIDIAPVLASLGVAGIAVALALQDTLSNYFAGITLAVDRPIRPGDYIKLEGGIEGYVQAIGWRTTRIQPMGETTVVVPNTKLANSIVTNTFYPDAAVRVYAEGGVSYESDLEVVEATSFTIATLVQKEVEGADPNFKPIFLYTEFGDSNITFKVVMRSLNYGNSAVLKHEFIKRLHFAFTEKGIEMNYPVRKLVGWPSPPKDGE